jgi:putative PEP-CTERM system histidine kinase
VRGVDRGTALGFAAAGLTEAAWAGATAVGVSADAPPVGLLAALESLRPAVWSILMLAMIRERGPARMFAGGAALAAGVATLAFLAQVHGSLPREGFALGLVAAVFCLLCAERLYRGTAESRRWTIKYLCLAVGALAAFDVVLYADAMLFGRLEPSWWTARGWAHALMAPLAAASAARLPSWRLGVRVSRKVALHSATLLAACLFVLAVAAIGYGLDYFGDAWSGVARTLVAFAAPVALVALASSGRLRARLRVLVIKHFYRYRYDYRAEWLRLTELLARPERPGEPDDTPSQRALSGLAALVESPGGALWLRSDDGAFVCDATSGMPGRAAIAADAPLADLVGRDDWIVDVPEWRAHPERYPQLGLPQEIADDPEAWLLVPLRLHGDSIGLVQLQRPVAPVPLDWEVRDVLKTAGRQVAGHLAVHQAVEKLVLARQFESFNRMSAFVVHDLKNLLAQLTLLLGNASRHRDNPEFQRDMLETVRNVTGRMQGLLVQLRAGTPPTEAARPILLGETLRRALCARAGLHPEPVLDVSEEAEHAELAAHRDRLERVIGHLVQNAVEATPAGGSVRVVARLDGADAVVRIVDTGRGMSRAFVDTRLFRPFTSTKEHGMGIGAFESREYVRELGGSLTVDSAEGRGTTFTIRLPARAPVPAPAMER